MEKGVVFNDFMNALSFSNPHIVQVLIPCALAFLFGYLVYIYCIIIMKREHISCYPVWMHTFYLACDTIGAVFWFIEWIQNDYFWAFIAFSICLLIWVACEIWALAKDVQYNKQEEWGKYHKDPVTTRQAWGHIIGQTVMFGTVIGSIVYYMGGLNDLAFFKLYFWTNLLVALGPCHTWMKRQSRVGSGVNIQIMILISIILTWMPAGIGMWATVSSYFWTPTCIIAGIVATAYAIFNLMQQLKFAPKPELMNGKKPLR